MKATIEMDYPLIDGPITIRRAKLSDRDQLLEWRNDLDTRIACRDQGLVSQQRHHEWFGKVLEDPSRQLMMVEFENQPAGMLRLDLGHQNELSWTVSPDFRGRGIGSAMVKLLTGSVDCEVVAHVREENLASIRIAQTAGLIELAREDGFIIFGTRDVGESNE